MRLRVLGPIMVEPAGAPPPPSLLWRKNLGLLLYLARSPRGTRSREHLIGLLWADRPEAQARHSLNESIHTLRSALGDDRLDTSAGHVRLVGDTVRLDVEELERLAAAGDWAGAASLAGGEFCEGFGVAGASAFEDWLTAERTFWGQRQVEVLLRRADDLERRGFATSAAAAAKRALALDPTSEPAMRALLTGLALAGERTSALAHFESFRRDLNDRLGLQPDRETLVLVQRLRDGALRRRLPARPTSAAETRRLQLVGREVELQRLLGMMRMSHQTPRAALAVVEAHAGLGRTRLLEEVADRAALDGVSVVAARAVTADRADPASGIVALACGGLLDAPGIAGAPGAALAALSGRITEWAERFRAPTGTEAMSPGRSLVEIVRAAAGERPVLVAIDDAQWLDTESWGTIEVLLRDLARAPLAIVLSVQPDSSIAELDALRARLGREIAGDSLRLQSLGAADIVVLVTQVIPGLTDAQRDRLARRVLADSAGLPLFVVELLHAISSGLDPDKLASGWPAPFRTLDHTLPGGLPDAIVAAIRVGFRRLTKEAQRTLATAAALDDLVALRQLAAITGLGEDATAAALDELEWSRWLLADARGYAFVARIVREVIARDMLTQGQRQRIAARRELFLKGDGA